MLRIDFGCTYVAYCWTSRVDKVIFPPHLYFLPVISGFYFKIILHILISLYSESAGGLPVIYMFYWCDRIVTFLQTCLSLGGECGGHTLG